MSITHVNEDIVWKEINDVKKKSHLKMDESFRKFPNIKCENKLITEGKITLNKQINI